MRGSSRQRLALLACLGAATCGPPAPDETVDLALSGEIPSPASRELAARAVATYSEEAVATLGDLVAFRTVHREGLANEDNPEFRRMIAYLGARAEAFGLDFEDHGPVVVLGLGEAEERLGIVTHGDVQPADAAKWAGDPFVLDLESEPGRLVGRGTEDDKGPLALALYGMKALAESELPLARRIELIVALTEESDWEPLEDFFVAWVPPELNVAFDASYPVVVAEKGWGEIHLTVPDGVGLDPTFPTLRRLSGGAFLSQVPADAVAEIAGAGPELAGALAAAAAEAGGDVAFAVEPMPGGGVRVAARGRSAHSSTPWQGANAITHLAELLGRFEWPPTAAARLVRFVNDLVGTGDLGEKFGTLAHADEFMGPLTLTLAKVEPGEESATARLSLRRPRGRPRHEIEAEIEAIVGTWAAEQAIDDVRLQLEIGDPYVAEDAPHVPVLLEVFRHYTGDAAAEPLAIGGGTNARLVPNGVSFGPAMPGVPYTGHSEHEFMSRRQLELNLEMYTALMAELALAETVRDGA